MSAYGFDRVLRAPGFWLVLALCVSVLAGGVLAAGPISACVTSSVLSDAFGIALRIDEEDGRFSARLG